MPNQFVRDDDPGDVFAALADEIRVAILQSLRARPESTASFSTLQDAVEIEDSGRFNYHLGKLIGRFIRKTDNGYELTQAGKSIVGAIESGAYTTNSEISPIRLDESCRFCGATQHLSYRNEYVSVECDSCHAAYDFAVPPVVFAKCDSAEIPDLASRHLRTIIQLQYAGFCSFCNGRITQTVGPLSEFDSTAILPDEHLEEDASLRESPAVEFDCQQCGATAFSGIGDVLLDHPSVIGFYDDHGINLRERHCWAFPSADGFDVDVLRDSPFRLEVTYSCGGESLSVRVDEQLAVLGTERRPCD